MKGGKKTNPSYNFHTESCERCPTADAAVMIGCQPHCSRTSLHVTTSTKVLVRKLPHLRILNITPQHLIYYRFLLSGSITLHPPTTSVWLNLWVYLEQETSHLEPATCLAFLFCFSFYHSCCSEGCRGRKAEGVKEGSRGAKLNVTPIWCFCTRPWSLEKEQWGRTSL